MTDAVPWVKWHFDKWRGDNGLRACCLAARGLWADLLAVMHDATPYGHLAIKGRQPTNRQVASLVGMTTEREVAQLLMELEDNGVFSRTDEGLIYCRRLVRDHQAREKGKAFGREGGNPLLTRRVADEVNPDPKGGGLTPPVKIEKEKEKEEEEEKKETSLRDEKKMAAQRRKQVPPDWQPTEAGRGYAKDRSLQPTEVAAFRNFHIAKGNTFANLDRAWLTWCDKAVEFGRGRPVALLSDLYSLAPGVSV